ncbi:MAG TPA: VOC family protein [Candidatus Sulfotelmatobacter sp.]|nr:VOC family protein [Candidatus Sulfotelmatobacter sp.]
MRNSSLVVTILVLAAGMPWSQPKAVAADTNQSTNKETNKTMQVKRITPVLFVEEVEPCVKFWVERMGFEKTVEVPGENGKLAFATLQKGNVELMYQSYASVERDIPAVAQSVRKGPTFLYIEVDSLDQAITASKGAELVMPVRNTFYGSKEIGIKDPAGHFVTFAEFGKTAQK